MTEHVALDFLRDALARQGNAAEKQLDLLTPEDVSRIEAMLKGLTEQQLAELATPLAQQLLIPWHPQPGPQEVAYNHPADEVLYGGAAGGGKTDLLLGLATTKHYRSLLFRRQAVDLDGLWERLSAMLRDKQMEGEKNSVKKRMITTDGRLIEMGHLEQPGAELSWQGRAHDLIGFDEAAQLDEFKVTFVMQWLRSTNPDQRCRAVFATNPPIPDMRDGKMVDSSSGEWLKRWFAPWIDPHYKNPAKPGETRWCYTLMKGDKLHTIWVDGPGWYSTLTGERWHEESPAPAVVMGAQLAKARSRTFVRSLVSDNAYLRDSGYVERLSSTPEPLRSMLMSGTFGIKMADHEWQIIPTVWVLQAEDRWRRKMERIEVGDDVLDDMCVLSADIAQGGMDSTVLAPLREDNMFDMPSVFPGSDTPDGPSVVRRLLDLRRDGALIVLDGGGGWGGSTRDQLKMQHKIDAIMCIPGAASADLSKDMQFKFLNVRAAMWWLFREALDPDSGHEIMLPPDDTLRAQLTSPHFGLRGRTVVVEAKDEVRKRIGSSTDVADAILQAWKYKAFAMSVKHRLDPVLARHGARHRAEDDRPGYGVGMDDPLSEWDA